MEEVLLKLGFKKEGELFIINKVIDNSIICKLWEIQDRDKTNTTLKYELYKYRTLYEPPIVDYISVNILEDKFDLNFKTENSNTTHTLPINFFIIFEELLIDRRDKLLTNLFHKT